MWLQRFEIDDEFRMFGSLILYDEGSTKVLLLPFQIIVSLIFFTPSLTTRLIQKIV